MTARKRTLSVVGPDDPPPPRKEFTSILEAATQGGRLDELVAMRNRLARALDDSNTSPRDLASLSRRQLEISREIEDMQRRALEEAEEDAITPDEEWTAI